MQHMMNMTTTKQHTTVLSSPVSLINAAGSRLVSVLTTSLSATARDHTRLFIVIACCVLVTAAGIVFYSAGDIAVKPAKFAVQSRRPVVPSKLRKSVLVTGAAGFIGFHLASALADQREIRHHIIGVDNFNDYYDVRLKHARAKTLLKSRGITVLRADVCDVRRLHSIITSHGITHVVHLAAQAGVRFSLKDPNSYITANVECFTKLLILLDQFPAVKLVYASSSSVYGGEAPVPFAAPWPPFAPSATSSSLQTHPSQAMDTMNSFSEFEVLSGSVPNNMYAATKLTGELLAMVHCNKRRRTDSSFPLGLAPVGLRFFTVYGPWGRPDMAIYSFAEAMLAGKSVELFQAEDNLVMSRDFTYVDDIISGILATMDYEPSTCGEVFNLGFGQPISVPEMLHILENELNLTATVVKVPRPPTELLQTFADISDSAKYLNFKPKCDTRQGIRSFVGWLQSYRRTMTNNSDVRRIHSTLKE